MVPSGGDAIKVEGRFTFSLKPNAPFRLDLAAWTLRRRPENVVDRWDGETFRRVLSLENGPAEVEARQIGPIDSPRLRVVVVGAAATPKTRAAVTSALKPLLGLRVDLSEFERFAARDERLGPLSSRFRGMKPPRFLTVFECVVNAIACQQVTLTLGIRLLGRLAETYGQGINHNGAVAHAFPRPGDLARARPEEIRSLGFSLQKARAMIELSTAIVEGRLDLESLALETDEAAVERLCRL
jgi:DNA-3-methyladenine glycosylase II